MRKIISFALAVVGLAAVLGAGAPAQAVTSGASAPLAPVTVTQAASYKPAALISKNQPGVFVQRVTPEEKAVRKLAGEFWTCKTITSGGIAVFVPCYNTSDAGGSWRIEGTTSSPDELSIKTWNPPGAWTTSPVYANFYYNGTDPESGYLGGTTDGTTNYFLKGGSTISDSLTGKFEVQADGITWCVYIVHNSGSFSSGGC